MRALLIIIFISLPILAQNHGTSGTPGYNGSGGTADFNCGDLKVTFNDTINNYLYPLYKELHPDFDNQTQFKVWMKNYYVELLLIATNKKKKDKKSVEDIICEQDAFKFNNLDFLELSDENLDNFDYAKHRFIKTHITEIRATLAGIMKNCKDTSDYRRMANMCYVLLEQFKLIPKPKE